MPVVPLALDPTTLDLPIITGVPCGPRAAPEGHVCESLSEYLGADTRTTRAVRVIGESMEGLGIEAGDALIFDESRTPVDGSVVLVASDDWEYTVKRYEPSSCPPGLYGYGPDGVRNHVRFDEAHIIGVLTRQIKSWT